MKRRLAIWALPLLAACTNQGYKVEPVVSPEDQRKVDIPDLEDEEIWQSQKCFKIEYYEAAWNRHTRELGIACIEEEDNEL